MSSQKLMRRPLVPGIMGTVASVALLAAPVADAADYNILCAGNPPPAHVNGIGQPFDDCSPLGVPGNASTYSLTLATEARAAWPFSGTDITGTCGAGGTAPRAVFRQTATSCAVWAYSGAPAGRVHLNSADKNCYCPTSADPTWK
jgi:hypothetical protein